MMRAMNPEKVLIMTENPTEMVEVVDSMVVMGVMDLMGLMDLMKMTATIRNENRIDHQVKK